MVAQTDEVQIVTGGIATVSIARHHFPAVSQSKTNACDAAWGSPIRFLARRIPAADPAVEFLCWMAEIAYDCFIAD